MKVFVGSDHRGYDEKNHILTFLKEKGYVVEDIGAFSKDVTDDFPVYAEALTSKLTVEDKGILLCGSGVGMSIAANKKNGVRAGLGFSIDQVKAARHDDDMNVLVIPTDYVSGEIVEQMVEAFLMTEFSTEEKYLRRKEEVKDLETHE